MVDISIFDVVGYIGRVLGSVRLVPQIVKSLRTKSTDDISYGMLGLSMASQTCTIAYTAHIDAMPLLVPVCESFGFTFAMSGVKCVFDRRSSTHYESADVDGDVML